MGNWDVAAQVVRGWHWRHCTALPTFQVEEDEGVEVAQLIGQLADIQAHVAQLEGGHTARLALDEVPFGQAGV